MNKADALANGKKESNKRLWITAAVIWLVALVAFFYIPIGYICASSSTQNWEIDPISLASAPVWTPDGARIVFGHRGGIYAVNQDGSALRRIHGSGGNDLYHSPVIYGGGSRIAYGKYPDGDTWTPMTSALDGSDERTLAENLDDVWGGNPHRQYSRYIISPDGSLIAFVETEYRGGRRASALYTSEYPREDNRSGWTKLVEGDEIGSPSWSPDGSRIAFVETDSVPDDNHAALYSTRVVSPNGSGLETVHQAVDRRNEYYEAAWSPDGTKLLVSGANFVSAANADGSGSRTLVRLYPLLKTQRELIASWSPDGSKIAVYNGGGYEGALFTMSPDGSDKQALVEYGNPIRPAQNQAWDPAYDAPTPAP